MTEKKKTTKKTAAKTTQETTPQSKTIKKVKKVVKKKIIVRRKHVKVAPEKPVVSKTIEKKAPLPVKKTKRTDTPKRQKAAPPTEVPEVPQKLSFDAILGGKPRSSSTEHQKTIREKRDGVHHDKKKFSTKKEEFNKALQYHKKKQRIFPVQSSPYPKEIQIMETVGVAEFARKMNIKGSQLIKKMMSMGQMVSINESIDSDTATLVAAEFDVSVKVVSLYDETVIDDQEIEDKKEDYTDRPPVVTIMGHVDHGKTTLLDVIRSSKITEGEAGGITQHIGAYRVTVEREGKTSTVTFLDTPGHSAFSMMRARGAQITDIVVLIVAADDGVMEQTIEAINHARDAQVPIIVAINKIDAPNAQVERVKQELSKYELISEEWGGQTIMVEVSAKNKTGIDKLLEMISIQSEIMELKANPKRLAVGTIVEARKDPGIGPVATVLIQNGTLKIGDAYIAGIYSGRVRSLLDEYGHKVDSAGPSIPVEVTGLTDVPDAGAPFQVVASERYARTIAAKRQEMNRRDTAQSYKKVTLENLFDHIEAGEIKELKIVLKADMGGSAEAIKKACEQLSTDKVAVRIIHSATGTINESDVHLASAGNAIILGYHVQANMKAMELAKAEKVEINNYDIIYEAIEDIKKAMEGLLDKVKREEITGHIEVRKTFKISRLGVIAGGHVLDGTVHRNSHVRLLRNDEKIWEGKLLSLKRFKDDVREVKEGFECGLQLDGYNDIQNNDIVEAYDIVEESQKL